MTVSCADAVDTGKGPRIILALSLNRFIFSLFRDPDAYAAKYRKSMDTICARMHGSFGRSLPSGVPVMMPFIVSQQNGS